MHKVALFEQHYNLGGMATWFKRRGGHVFDVSLHGFPYGMVKTCRRYWGAVYVTLTYWTRLYGLICMEVFGQLHWALQEAEPYFETQLCEMADSLGLERR